MVLNGSSHITHPPVETCKRLLWLVIVILSMLTNLYFQSRLSSINMVPDTHPTIDTAEDLLKSDLIICGTLSYKELLWDLEVHDRYQLVEYPQCVEQLRKGERVACIPGCIEARFSVHESEKFHISNQELRHFFMVFTTREDWPLLQRFNQIIRRMSEAGIIKLFRKRESRFFEHNFKNDKYHTITFQHLKFCFFVLFLGLSLGAFILFIEILLSIIQNTVSHDIKC